MSKLIRLSFNVDGESNFQRILVLPITDDESKKIVSDSGCNAEDSFNPLYEKIAMMNTVKTICNLEDVTPLPIRPILVDRDLKDILDDPNKEQP